MQLDFIQWLQSFHSPALDRVMVWITDLSSEDFYLLFGPLFFWCAGIGLGVRLLITLLGSFYLNDVLKELFSTDRPIAAHPDLVRMPEDAASSAQNEDGSWQAAFPSGHAQHTAVFWTFVGLWLRRTSIWLVVFSTIALVSLSRIYLGVHWPIDILGGWLIAAAVIGALILVPASIERLSAQGRERLILGAVGLALALVLIDGSDFRTRMLGFWTGSMVALLIQQRYVPFKVSGTVAIQIAKMIIGLAGLFVLRAGLKALLPEDIWAAWLRYALLGVWVVLGAPAVFRLLFGVPAPAPVETGESERSIAA